MLELHGIIMRSRVIQIPAYQHLSGPDVGQSHWLYCEKGPAETVFLLPANEVQSATRAAETVLLCHHWECSVFIYNCLVWLSYQIRQSGLQWTVRTAERITGASLPSLQVLYTSRVRKRAKKVTLVPSHPAHSLFELLLSEHQNKQTQQCFPPGHIPPEQHITHPSTVHL